MKQLSDIDFLSIARIQNLPAAAATGQPVTYEQWQAQIEGLAWKDDVKAAATTNINLASPGATVDGVVMSLNDRFIATGQTAPAENGIYVWNGASSPATRAADMSSSVEFNSAVVPVMSGGTTNGSTTWRCTSANITVGTDPVTFVAFQIASPNATETVSGTAEIATQAETDAGTDDTRIVTPLKLANHSGRKLKFVQNIGDGSATQIDVTHNFNTRDVQVTIYRNGTPWDDVACDISRPSVNAVRFNFAAGLPPTNNQFTVVVLG